MKRYLVWFIGYIDCIAGKVFSDLKRAPDVYKMNWITRAHAYTSCCRNETSQRIVAEDRASVVLSVEGHTSQKK